MKLELGSGLTPFACSSRQQHISVVLDRQLEAHAVKEMGPSFFVHNPHKKRWTHFFHRVRPNPPAAAPPPPRVWKLGPTGLNVFELEREDD